MSTIDLKNEGGIRLYPAVLDGAKIVPSGSMSELRARIESQQILIFRGVFSGSRMVEIRRMVQCWAQEIEPFPHNRSASIPSINFHRVDDGSRFSKLPHIFHQFGFGNLPELAPRLSCTLTPLSQVMLDFQNELAGTLLALRGDGLRPKLIRHPRGGGYLAAHQHPYLPQRVALFLNLSEPGKDYRSGGARFKVDGNWLDTFACFRLGDILAWRYDLIHDTAPVDVTQPLKWTGDDGFWIFALELEEIHKLSALSE